MKELSMAVDHVFDEIRRVHEKTDVWSVCLKHTACIVDRSGNPIDLADPEITKFIVMLRNAVPTILNDRHHFEALVGTLDTLAHENEALRTALGAAIANNRDLRDAIKKVEAIALRAVL